MIRPSSTSIVVLAASVSLALGACSQVSKIPGTTVADTPENHVVLKTVETYRQRLLEKNLEGMLVLASTKYFEDSGTPRADDDYGYEGLRDRLARTMARVKSIRYEIQYKNIRHTGDKAEVEVFITGAFELMSESGERYRQLTDYHRFVLERTGNDRWKFLSGM